MLWLLSFEIEIECDHRPVTLITMAKDIFDHRANAFEEVLLQCGLVA